VHTWIVRIVATLARRGRLYAGALACLAAGNAGCGSVLALHPPDVAPATSRDPTVVEIEPIAEARGEFAASAFAPPGPAAVLTSGLNADIAGRALQGGERGGYRVRCTLDRFAVRWRAALAEGSELLVLYADLSCEARRIADGAVVWRGELRARTAASGANVIASDADVTQRLTDRAVSDAAREMAGDLTVRALGLEGEPSARVFGDEGQLRQTGGLDDTPYGAAALTERAAAVEGAMRAQGENDALMRAAAWNVAAMAAGPGEDWKAGATMALDDDALVRFVQYKALARLGGPAAMARLEQALGAEGHPLLAELLRDTLPLHGIGVARKGYDARGGTNASPATNGTTARP
jgi:hypothetical protein